MDQDNTRYVEDLEGQGDYWMSVTDAARVCRVQDVSIRRAIAAGRLPVRRQGAGDNKRTRFVRASDLPRANFPIIDSSAAITSDIRKVDILSIPLQQHKLAEKQEAQATELAQLRGLLAQMQQAQREQAERYEQEQATARQAQIELLATIQKQQEEFREYRLEINQRIADLAEGLTSQLQGLGLRVIDLAQVQAEQHEEWQSELQALENKMDQITGTLASQVTHIISVQENDLEKIKRLRSQVDEMEQSQVQAITDLGDRIDQAKETLWAKMTWHLAEKLEKVQAQFDDMQRELNTLEKDQARDIADLSARIEEERGAIRSKLEELLSESNGIIARIGQQAGAHESRLTELFRLLTEEISARQALSEEIMLQKKTPGRARKASS